MRYLPDPSNTTYQPFWKRLVDKIQSLLEFTPVLRSRNEGPLRLIKSLRLPTTDSKDKDNNPLWDDIDPPYYVSPSYSWYDLMTLKSYGLGYIYINEIVAHAKRDLESPHSKMKASRDEDWHSRAAKTLAAPFVKGWDRSKTTLRGMGLIPLQNGLWISSNNGPIYYSSNSGMRIPTDLGLNLIDPTAAGNPDRKNLFDHLGATEASIDHVRSRILDRYNPSRSVAVVSLQMSRTHLEYLYLAQKHADVVVPLAFSNVYVYTEKELRRWPNIIDVYKPDTHQYGARELLKPTPRGSNPGDSAPGFAIQFLNQVYFESIPDRPAGHPFSWPSFLEKYLNIQLRPRLVRYPIRESASLSDITLYLQRYRPELLLRVIHYYWRSEGQKIIRQQSTVTEMRTLEVLCRGGRTITLFKTYLPTPSLERLQARYMVDSEFFPFLALLFPPEDDAGSDDWDFLNKQFGVGRNDDLDFYLTMLNCILDANKSVETVVNMPRVYGVYGHIQAKLLLSQDQSTQRGKIMYVDLQGGNRAAFSDAKVFQRTIRGEFRHFDTTIPSTLCSMGST